MPNKQFIVYGLIGLIGTAGHYLVLIGGMKLFSSPLLFTSLGSIAGALINHDLNRRFTFSTNKPYLRTLFESFNVAGIMFLGNLGLMYIFLTFSSLHYLIAQIFTTAVVFLLGFFINKYIVFLHVSN